MISRTSALVTLIILVCYFVIWWLLQPSDPQTYAQRAQTYKSQCVAAKGSGNWRASSGITLDKYCELLGTIRASKDLCREQPENC